LPDYATAFYHSAVNFTTLGYGDIVMPPGWRLLSPLEAANRPNVRSVGLRHVRPYEPVARVAAPTPAPGSESVSGVTRILMV
jgi:hypothetical protein